MHLRWSRAAVALLIVGGTAALGVGAIGTGSATAAPTCTIAPCPPPNTSISASPGDTGGPKALTSKWTVPSGYQIDGAQATVTWSSTGGPAGVPQPAKTTVTVPLDVCQTAPPRGGSQECDGPWPPELEKNGYVLNGTYTVTVVARICDTLTVVICSTTTTVQATASVANKPTPPTNVKASLATASAKGVTVTWDPSPEPDVFAYVVRRSGSSAPVGGCAMSFAPADLGALPPCSGGLKANDATSGGGDFTYQISAVRFGRTYAYADRRESDPSATNKITVPGPPAATTVPAGSLGGVFGVLNAPKAKPSSGFPVLGLNPKLPPGIVATTVDPGFSQVLPYGPTTDTTAKPTVVAGPVVPAPKGKSSVKSIALVGAGVLVTVIAMHGLWLRSEVRRSGALEVLEPEL